MQIGKAILAYEIDLRAENKSLATIRWYTHKLRYFTEHLEQQGLSLEIAALRREHITAFLVRLRDASDTVDGRRLSNGRLSSLTVKGYAQVIKTFCGWLARNGLFAENPAEKLPMPKVERYVIQAFTAEDVRQMLKAAQNRRHAERDHTVILLLYDTAMRAGELVSLKLEGVDLERGWLHVKGKGGAERMVPLGQTARRALWRYIHLFRPEPLLPAMREVFLNERREPLSVYGVWRIVRRVAETAGVNGKRLSPHTLRHAAAEDFLRNGGDAFTLQKLLGHTTLAVTRMYVDLVAKDVAEAHKRASPGDNLRLRLR